MTVYLRWSLGSCAGHHPGVPKLQGPNGGRPFQSKAQCHWCVCAHLNCPLVFFYVIYLFCNNIWMYFECTY